MIPELHNARSAIRGALCAFVVGLTAAAQAAAQSTLSETAELLAPDAQPGQFVGWDVAADGDTLVVGSFDQPGSAYVFVRNGPGWDLQAKLVPAQATHYYLFGTALALDGDTLIGGAAGEDGGAGAFYVFERTGTAWDAGTRYTLPGTAGVGSSVDIDGDRIAVGANGDNGSKGAVFVLARTPTGWSVEQKLTAVAPTGIERLGSSVALEGDVILAGAPIAGDFGPQSGRAYLFEFNGATWIEKQLLLPHDPQADTYFGDAVALSGDDLAVGAPASNFPPLGAVYVYSRESGSPIEVAKLVTPTLDPLDRFGSALALDDGQLVIGAHIAFGGTGAAYVYQRFGELWGSTYQLVPTALDPDSRFGLSVASSGTDVVVGAPYGTPAGSAFVFSVQPSPTFQYCQATPNTTGKACAIGSTGSTSLGDNSFVLRASQAPAYAPAMFLCGPDHAQFPFGPGYLCISPFFPGIFRLTPGVQADAVGSASYPVDFLDLPPGCVIAPGSTWYFQLWYRDANSAGFNLSNGLGATFAP